MRRAIPLLAIIAFTLVFFYKLAFTDLILGRGDTYAYFYPYWGARNDALAEGRLPLWTPDIFMGAPLLADPQLGTFYPPNWLTVPFNPPDAVRISILMHIAWAMLGTYLLARRALSLDRTPALFAGALFALGGYITSHVEQINQLQGLAWMPWLFLALHIALRQPRRYIPLLGIALAMQVFTGHTQTVFITLLGLGVYGILQLGAGKMMATPFGAIFATILTLLFAGIIALLLASPQIIPTLELMRTSNRSGGLNQNQATAFSFSPLVMGRGLLPSYDGQLFGEYVAYPGIIGLGFAVIGVLRGRRQSPPTVHMGGTTGILVHEGGRIGTGLQAQLVNGLSRRTIWLIIALLGLTLALGLYNPIYWLLASLPGFNLFRVPARWLALFALGTSMLAGLGLQSLIVMPERPSRRVLAAIFIVIAALVGASLLMQIAPPEDITGPAIPTLRTFVLWAITLIGLLAFIWIQHTARLSPNLKGMLITGLSFAELFVAAHVLPLNHLTPPEVYNDQRFTISQMQVYAEDSIVPGRMLSLSDLLFDPGDIGTLQTRYQARGLSDLAIRHSLVAVKRQETLFPNLPLTWGIPSVDGYGGGLLPTTYYTQFTSLLLPPDELKTIDGRLGEIMYRPECFGACIPAQHWLNLTDTKYLIVDKVYDVVHEGIFYDTTFSSQPIYGLIGFRLPDFEADTVNILYRGEQAPEIRFVFSEPTITAQPIQIEPIENGLAIAQYSYPELSDNAHLNIFASPDFTIYAATVVDSRTGDFVQLVPEEWQRVLSSDIKLYESMLGNRRHAFVINEVIVLPDTPEGSDTALNLMRSDEYGELIGYGQVGIVHNEQHDFPVGTSDSTTTRIVSYDDERVEIEVDNSTPSILVLNDAYYPGWTATVNGEETPIYRADVMFRAVRIPAGESTVIFQYQPSWLPGAFVFGAMMWVGMLFLTIWAWRKKRVAVSS